MRIKRSGAIIVLLEGESFVFHNYLTQQTFSANPTTLEILRLLHDWTELGALQDIAPGYSSASISAAIDELKELGVVIAEDSEAADHEQDFSSRWLWGPLTAAYHLGSRQGDFLAAEDVDALLAEQIKFFPSPPLYTINDDPETDVALPVQDTYPEPFGTMARRRTNRFMQKAPIGLEGLADCFLFSMAITAMIEDPEIVDLPLKMTPSGGGRNPYEAYVCVRDVTGLSPGTYHYSALQGTLGRVRDGPPPAFPAMLANQDWTGNAAAVIFLVANFERSMWKYHHSSAYRITMIEAGHIAQNMMLVATHHGFVANPTGAMNLDLVESTLRVADLTRSAIYALVLGVPDTDPKPEIA